MSPSLQCIYFRVFLKAVQIIFSIEVSESMVLCRLPEKGVPGSIHGNLACDNFSCIPRSIPLFHRFNPGWESVLVLWKEKSAPIMAGSDKKSLNAVVEHRTYTKTGTYEELHLSEAYHNNNLIHVLFPRLCKRSHLYFRTCVHIIFPGERLIRLTSVFLHLTWYSTKFEIGFFSGYNLTPLYI